MTERSTIGGAGPPWKRGIGDVPYSGFDSRYGGTRKRQYYPKDVVPYLLSVVLFDGHSSSNFKALRDFFDSGKEESAGALVEGEVALLGTRSMGVGMSGGGAVPLPADLLQ